MEALKYAVICVDDDPIILQLIDFQMKKLINERTTIVETTTDPRQVEAKIEEVRSFGLEPLFIMTDYQMPGMSGAELIRKLKEKEPSLDCILLSGQANDRAVEELERDHLLYSFIGKPWKEEQLLEVLTPFIERSQTN
jgi:CheY-like chemotaxis protein